MPIPDYQSIMLPLLRFASDGREHSLRETIGVLADEFGLTGGERRDLLPSGQQTVFDNRVGWARTYMKKVGLLESTRRGHYRITNRGMSVLHQNPPLGLDVVYVQAKRWDGPVGRPEIQKFAGALEGQRARKGISITTSTFTQDAEDYVSPIGSRIVLVDGETLAERMIHHNVGVAPLASYELNRVNSDYLAEE
jgi:restriction endonuclease Mrr